MLNPCAGHYVARRPQRSTRLTVLNPLPSDYLASSSTPSTGGSTGGRCPIQRPAEGACHV